MVRIVRCKMIGSTIAGQEAERDRAAELRCVGEEDGIAGIAPGPSIAQAGGRPGEHEFTRK